METLFENDVATKRTDLNTRVFHNRPLLGSGLLAFVCLTAAMIAQAQQISPFSAAETVDQAAPWMPDVITAIDPYIADPQFNGGRFYLDHFSSSNASDEVGALAAALPNGDTVVVGLVPHFGTTGTCNDGVHQCSIGLVRYNPQGVRVAWSNPGNIGHYNNNYVVFGGDFDTEYLYIRDVKVYGDRIIVLVDRRTSQPGLGRQDVWFVQFRTDGSLAQIARAFGGNYTSDPDDFYGTGIVKTSNNHLMIVATAYDASTSYPAVTQFNMDASGNALPDPNWGSAYDGGFERWRTYALGYPTTASYVVAPTGVASVDDFYISGNIAFQGDNDVIVFKVSSLTGNLKNEFGGNGLGIVAFDQAGSNKNDYPAGLYVYLNDVYVAAKVAQKCFPGIGLAKLDGATAGYISSFGTGGKVVFGGQGNVQSCYQFAQTDDPQGISATGGRIGIVGNRLTGISTTNIQVDPMLAVVNAQSGTVLSLDKYPLLRANGTRYGDAVLYGIYGGPSPFSPFTVAGNGRDASAGNTLSYVTGKFIPLSADRIFANGFEN